MDVIDAHFHIWDPALQRLPWLDRADASLNRKWTVHDLAQCYRSFAPDGIRFRGGIYVEVDCDDPQAEDMLVYDNHDPRILGRVMRSTVSRYMRVPLFADGIRDPLHVDSSKRGRCLDDSFIDGLRLLGRRGIPFDACVRVDELNDLAEAHEQAPDATIVIDHLGNVTPSGFDSGYRKAMSRLAQVPGTYVKLSGYPTADSGFVHELLDFSRETFGSRRMFASNWPVVTTYSTFDEHFRLLLAQEGQNAELFAGTAARVYGVAGVCDGHREADVAMPRKR